MVNFVVIKLFLGPRYLSWLPSFSVEVTHSLRPATQIHTSQLETMARQVIRIFIFFCNVFIINIWL